MQVPFSGPPPAAKELMPKPVVRTELPSHISNPKQNAFQKA